MINKRWLTVWLWNCPDMGIGWSQFITRWKIEKHDFLNHWRWGVTPFFRQTLKWYVHGYSEHGTYITYQIVLIFILVSWRPPDSVWVVIFAFKDMFVYLFSKRKGPSRPVLPDFSELAWSLKPRRLDGFGVIRAIPPMSRSKVMVMGPQGWQWSFSHLDTPMNIESPTRVDLYPILSI